MLQERFQRSVDTINRCVVLFLSYSHCKY
jgi:hypothetical protein